MTISESHLVMQAVYTSVLLAVLCNLVVFAIGLQSPKSTGRNSKAKIRQTNSQGTKCGISLTAPNGGRIVGGEEARPHSWPWQVWIECRYIEGNDFVEDTCGGSIISEKWVMTAAHCLDQVHANIRRFCKLFLGKHYLLRNESTQMIAKIADYFIHEEYDPDDNDNVCDLALIKLAKRLKFTDAIQPICLPFGLPELPLNKSCYATGWGVTKYGREMSSNRLRQLSMTVTAEDNCSFPDDRIICTLQGRKKGICDGDSGGPLACQEQDRKWYLRGVLTQSSDKCDLVTVSTKVTSFEKWITNITSRN